MLYTQTSNTSWGMLNVVLRLGTSGRGTFGHKSGFSKMLTAQQGQLGEDGVPKFKCQNIYWCTGIANSGRVGLCWSIDIFEYYSTGSKPVYIIWRCYAVGRVSSLWWVLNVSGLFEAWFHHFSKLMEDTTWPWRLLSLVGEALEHRVLILPTVELQQHLLPPLHPRPVPALVEVWQHGRPAKQWVVVHVSDTKLTPFVKYVSGDQVSYKWVSQSILRNQSLINDIPCHSGHLWTAQWWSYGDVPGGGLNIRSFSFKIALTNMLTGHAIIGPAGVWIDKGSCST